MSLHKEISLENNICSHPASHGRLHSHDDAEPYFLPSPSRLAPST